MIDLSIIIPVYNSSAYIEACLESILSPGSRDHIEIVLIDDGSTDDSGKICDQYARQNNCIKVLHKANEGVSIARKTGLNEAGGTFVWFVDSDDYLLPGAIQTILSCIKAHPDINTFFAPVLMRDENSGREWIKPYAIPENQIVTGRQYLNRTPISVCPVQFVIKKELFQNKWIYFPEHLRHEDEYFCRVLQYFSDRMFMLEKPLYVYRQWAGSFMYSGEIQSINDMVEVFKHLSAFVEEGAEPQDRDWLRKDILSFLLGTHFWHREFLQTDDFKAFRKKNLPFIKKAFAANKHYLPLRERVIDQLMLSCPNLLQFFLGTEQSRKN